MTTTDALSTAAAAGNYFVLIDAGTSNYAVTHSLYLGNRMYYQATVNPCEDAGELWNLESTGTANQYNLRNVSSRRYPSGWDNWMRATTTEEWGNCATDFSVDNGKWTLKRGESEVGPWNNDKAVNTDGNTEPKVVGYENVAANKASGQPGFYIYTMSPSDFLALSINGAALNNGKNVSYFIKNPSFETTDNSGWTYSSSSDTGVKSNSGDYATTGTHGSYLFYTWWQGVPITQTVANLPNGAYTLKVSLASSDTDKDAKLFLLAQGNHSDVITITKNTKTTFNDYTYDFIVSDNSATIGVVGGTDAGEYTANGHWWYKADNFRLTYYGNGAEIYAPTPTDFSSATSAAEDTWYSFTVSNKGYYSITSSEDITLSYTQIGTKNVEDDDFATLNIDADDTESLLLSAGTFYFKGDATSNITITSLGDGVQYYAPTPTDFSSATGVTTSNWYSCTLASSGYYRISSTAAVTLSYTLDGTKDVDDDDFSTVNIAESSNVEMNISAGTLYFKSNANSNITIELLWADGADITSSFITNPSFEGSGSGSYIGWSVNYGGATSHNSDEIQSGNLAEGAGNYYFKSWRNTTTGGYVHQTISLPAGHYSLSALLEGNVGTNSVFYVKAGDTENAETLPESWSTSRITVYFDMAAAGDITISGGCRNSDEYHIDDFRLTYNPTLPASLTAVSGDMNSTVASTQSSAITTYSGSKTFANLLAAQTAINAALASKLVYNDISTIRTSYATKAASLDAAGRAAYETAINATTDGAAWKYTNGVYETAAQAETTFHDDYITAVKAQTTPNTDMTEVITNPSFETGNVTGWSAPSRDDTSVRLNSNETYKITNGDAVDGNYLFNCWGGTDENYVQQTISLPSGNYRLTALVAGFKGETLTLAANSTTNSVVVADNGEKSKKYGYDVSVEFTLTTTTDVIIKASNTKSQNTSDRSFIKADNFRLTYLSSYYAVDADYDDLSDAITSAEGRTLGFEDGEYAPYNNTEILAKLDEARDYIDEDPREAHLRSDFLTLIADLESDASWTANDGEVNAICGGDFTQYETISGKDYPYGWNLYNGETNHSRIMGGTEGSSNTGLSATSSSKALLLKYNGTYGETEGYTMPLKAGTIYRITFKHGRWNEANPRNTDVVMTDPNGASIALAPAFQAAEDHCESNSENWFTYTGYFVSTTAGNYKLNFNKEPAGQGQNDQMQIALGDIDLRSASSLELSQNDVIAYAAGTYPTVTISDRTLFATDKWNTLCLPFDMDASNFGSVKEITGVTTSGENVRLTMSSVDGTLEAGNVYFVKAENTSQIVSAEDVTMAAYSENPSPTSFKSADEKTTVEVIGNYKKKTISSNEWFLGTDNKFYYADEAVTVKGYRAIFAVTTDASVKSILFNFDDADGISAVQGSEFRVNGSEIYNLAGQKLSRPMKGVNIVNGKKVLVK